MALVVGLLSRATGLERRSEKMVRKGRSNGDNDICPSHIYRVRPAQLAAVASLANSSRSNSAHSNGSNRTPNISAAVLITVFQFHNLLRDGVVSSVSSLGSGGRASATTLR
jgi:hypothetical protein